MKFLVDELPYYGDVCLFEVANVCCDAETEYCPIQWSKYKILEDNPHECIYLQEFERYKSLNLD